MIRAIYANKFEQYDPVADPAPLCPLFWGDHKAYFVDFYGKMSAWLAMQEDPGWKQDFATYI